ncbi:MAG: acetate--CoA ligase family protein [Candidatus Micrarchaeia archaeon]
MQLEYFKAKKILDDYNIKSIESKYVNNAEEAKKFCGNSKIVLKAISEKAVHKSKAGLVILDLDKESVERGYNELVKLAEKVKPYKIIAQKMSKKGIEIIIGGRDDAQFGRLILIGLGGIYVEAFKDFALRLCPIKEYDAKSMLDQLRSKNVITYNGEAEAQLIKLLMKVSKLLIDHKEIKELDLNPAIIYKDGYEMVDIRMII